MTFIKCASHRSRQKVQSALDREPQSFYSWRRACTGGYLEIETSEAEIVRAITGVSVLRGDTSDLAPCWSVK